MKDFNTAAGLRSGTERRLRRDLPHLTQQHDLAAAHSVVAVVAALGEAVGEVHSLECQSGKTSITP